MFRGEQKRMRRLLVIGHPKVKATVSVESAKAARAAKAATDREKLVSLVS